MFSELHTEKEEPGKIYHVCDVGVEATRVQTMTQHFLMAVEGTVNDRRSERANDHFCD